MQAAIEGTREIGLAVLATTLSLVIVFLPVSFLSSVTGRMLFQFGMTATVAILVSMLVSFSLTPMMCSRCCKPADADRAAARLRGAGSISWIEVGYMWPPAAGRCGIAGSCCCCRSAAIAANCAALRPGQAGLHSDQCRRIGVRGQRHRAAKGRAWRRWTKSLQRVESEISRDRRRRACARRPSARAASAASTAARCTSGWPTSTTRSFSLGRLWRGLLAGDPGAALRRQLHAARQDERGPRAAASSSRTCASSVRNLTSLRQGAPVDIDFAITGPGRRRRWPSSASKLRQKAKEMPGIVDVDTTLRLDKPELLVQHRPRAGRGAGRRRRRKLPRRCASPSAATTASRAIATRRPTTPTTSNCGWWASTAATCESISQLYVRAKPGAMRLPAP